MRRPLHGMHAALLAGSVPLFLGVLICDITYSRTYEIQWKNFSSWLLVGALVFCGFALLGSLIGSVRDRFRPSLRVVNGIVLLVLFVLGVINALLHSADAAASLSSALTISWIVAALSILATWLSFGHLYQQVAP